jgi:hypothetical protein
MDGYFDNVERQLRSATRRRAHLPWLTRFAWTRIRGIAAVLAVLVIATPAVAAVSGWFSVGKPNPAGHASPAAGTGAVRAGTARMLPIRIADPGGGPRWGLRLVRTSRGDTCLQLGRVEHGEIGSLGINGAWDNDHEFHEIPANAAYADVCGATDAVGHGYFNDAQLGDNNNANPFPDHDCRIRGAGGGGSQLAAVCPAGSNRLVFLGLLGPDAASIVYKKPGGGLGTERTVGGVGAYLLVFRYSSRNCELYSNSPTSAHSCPSDSFAGSSPGSAGAVTEVTYRDGRSCTVESHDDALATDALVRLHPHQEYLAGPESRRMWARVLERYNLTPQQGLRQASGHCAAAGWVQRSGPEVTAAEVASPIHLLRFRPHPETNLSYGCGHHRQSTTPCDGKPRPLEYPLSFSVTARVPIHSGAAWYEWFLQYPRDRSCGGVGSGRTVDRNVNVGTVLRYSANVDGPCHGVFTISVAYVRGSPTNERPAGVGFLRLSGRRSGNGVAVVGVKRFRIP